MENLKVAGKSMLSMKESLGPSSIVRDFSEPFTEMSKKRISSFARQSADGPNVVMRT